MNSSNWQFVFFRYFASFLFILSHSLLVLDHLPVGAALHGLGEVTVVFSKKGYNVGPKGIKIIVTNLTELTEKCLLSIYQRRWMIEILFCGTVNVKGIVPVVQVTNYYIGS